MTNAGNTVLTMFAHMRPFQEQGFHEFQHCWLPFVDPIWLDVLRLVSRGWCASIISTVCTRAFSVLTVRMQATTSVVVITGPLRELYIRANKGSRVFAHGLKRVHTDSNGDCTYVRNHTVYWGGHSRDRKYFRIENGKVGVVH
jgi:hypothetical protein